MAGLHPSVPAGDAGTGAPRKGREPGDVRALSGALHPVQLLHFHHDLPLPGVLVPLPAGVAAHALEGERTVLPAFRTLLPPGGRSRGNSADSGALCAAGNRFGKFQLSGHREAVFHHCGHAGPTDAAGGDRAGTGPLAQHLLRRHGLPDAAPLFYEPGDSAAAEGGLRCAADPLLSELLPERTELHLARLSLSQQPSLPAGLHLCFPAAVHVL